MAGREAVLMRWRRLRFPIWGLVVLVAISAVGFSVYRRRYLSHAVPLERLREVRAGMPADQVEVILGKAHNVYVDPDSPATEWNYSRVLCKCRVTVVLMPWGGPRSVVAGVHHYHE
jgi:hypothetical protein